MTKKRNSIAKDVKTNKLYKPKVVKPKKKQLLEDEWEDEINEYRIDEDWDNYDLDDLDLYFKDDIGYETD